MREKGRSESCVSAGDPAVGTAAAAELWTGSWVLERLAMEISSSCSSGGLSLEKLVGLAIRRNPRRAHLLVSNVLGKHVPADPRLVYGVGLALGETVDRFLAGLGDTGHPSELPAALGGDAVALGSLLNSLRLAREARGSRDEFGPPTVLGFAETATGLGHAVADFLDAPYIHSTRRSVPGIAPLAGFTEEHSHAADHHLLPSDSQFMNRAGALVLVDDELTTGRTAMNTILALHQQSPRSHYVLASLVDLRTPTDCAVAGDLARRLGVQIDVVSLVSGEVRQPSDVLRRAAGVLDQYGAEEPVLLTTSSTAPVTELEVRWPPHVLETGRHGYESQDRTELDATLHEAASPIIELLRGLEPGSHVHLLGTEEFTYVPLRLAIQVAEDLPQATVTFSSTTRSPVLPIDEPGYAIRSSLTFLSHDDPTDGSSVRYAYNLGSGDDAQFDAIVVLVEASADSPSLRSSGGLVAALRHITRRVLVIVIPRRSSPVGLSAP